MTGIDVRHARARAAVWFKDPTTGAYVSVRLEDVELVEESAA